MRWKSESISQVWLEDHTSRSNQWPRWLENSGRCSTKSNYSKLWACKSVMHILCLRKKLPFSGEVAPLSLYNQSNIHGLAKWKSKWQAHSPHFLFPALLQKGHRHGHMQLFKGITWQCLKSDKCMPLTHRSQQLMSIWKVTSKSQFSGLVLLEVIVIQLSCLVHGILCDGRWCLAIFSCFLTNSFIFFFLA